MRADSIAPYPGMFGRVIKDGGAYDAPMIVSRVGEDDEQYWGTWFDVITDPESSERQHLKALCKDSEQQARDLSAIHRRVYFCWLDDPQPEPATEV